jgi:hypothetical protein
MVEPDVAPEYAAYRTVAEPLESVFYAEFKAGRSPRTLAWLCGEFRAARSRQARIVVLGLLAGALLVQGETEGVGESAGFLRRLDYIHGYLLRHASFDPRACISASGYFLHVRKDLPRAKGAAVRACGVAESMRAYIRDANQTLIRVCAADGDWPVMEVAVLQITGYWPGGGSPDPAIERDVVEKVRAAPIDSVVKRRFLQRLAAELD